METACPLLWNHYCIGATSVVKPCCRAERNHLEDWINNEIKDGIYSENHIKTRELMRNGKRPKVCSVCYEKEDNGLTSSRLNYLNTYKNINYNKEPNKVLTADIKFNNTCNLACRMCGPFSSSLIASLLKDVPQKDRIHNVRVRKHNYKEEEKLEYCKQLIINGLQEFKTTGGEPFYQKHFIKLLDWCIENNYNKGLAIKITTNGLQVNKNVIDKLLSFKHCTINISIDGYKKVYEYIRYPGKWSDLDANLRQLIQHTSSTFTVNISTLLNIYNIFDIPNIEKYLKSVGYEKELRVDCYIKPYAKSELNVKNLPDEIINYAIERNTNKQVIQYLTKCKQEYKDSFLLKEFARKTKLYDKQRNQTYKVLDNYIVQII